MELEKHLGTLLLVDSGKHQHMLKARGETQLCRLSKYSLHMILDYERKKITSQQRNLAVSVQGYHHTNVTNQCHIPPDTMF